MRTLKSRAAVGIPARILEEEKAKKRQASAENMGFSAYAVGNDENDPMIKAINSLLDHAHKQDVEIAELKSKLSKLSDAETESGVGEAFAKKSE